MTGLTNTLNKDVFVYIAYFDIKMSKIELRHLDIQIIVFMCQLKAF